jgi:putative endonuclease
MKVWDWIRARREHSERPLHLQYGALGESAARRHLRGLGLKFLTANFRSPRGEIDLVFRQDDCLVFVEVKTRSSGNWARPIAAVDRRKRRLLSMTAIDYLKKLRKHPIQIRFDVVEVLLEGGLVREIRHLPNTFTLSSPYFYG